jgi:tripartite-type tricarboxylate transporter receptor subunit TctC
MLGGTLALSLALSLGLAAFAAEPAMAADYPESPITMLVGYGAGGQTDLVARATAKVMSEKLGVPINVVNKPGAGGAVAARDLQKLQPDGYTILFNSNTVVNSAPFIMDRVDFKPDDFEYAGMITAFQVGMTAPKDAPFDNITEYVDWAGKNPGSSYGALSPEARLYIEQIARKTGIKVNIVPLQSGSEMINALLGGQVMMAFSGGIHYRYPDQLKTVSALTSFRHPSAPDVPTIEEEGFPLGMDSRTTLFLPKGTPAAILEKLSEALKAAETDAGFKKIADAASIPIKYFDVAAANKEMRDTYAKNKGIMEAAGLVK